MAETKKRLEFQPDDLRAAYAYLEETGEPIAMAALQQQLVDRKLASLARKRIKIFDPRCDYEVGDLVLKKYDEALRAGKTRTVHVSEEILLSVVDRFRHPVLPCTMLEVKYEGGGSFKLHTEFLAKTGAKLLIPCAQDDAPIEPRYVDDAQDARFKEDEPTAEEVELYKATLAQEVEASPAFFRWQQLWYLADRRIEINPAIIHRAEKLIRDRRGSVATEHILAEVFSTTPDDVRFPTLAISFDHTLDSFYSKKFVCVAFKGWGRWNLAENLEAKKNSTRALRARLEDFVETIEGEEEILARKRERVGVPFLEPVDRAIRMALSFRDIVAGSLRPMHLPPGFFAQEREIPVAAGAKRFMIDFFPEFGLLLGFGDLFARCRQGDIVQLRRQDDGYLLQFETVDKAVDGIGFHYDERKDLIVAADERRSSTCRTLAEALVTTEELQRIEPLQPEIHRRRDLYEAVAKLMHHLGDPKKSFPMNMMKLYHLVDVLAFVPWEKYLRLLLSYPAFYQRSEDVAEGMFRLDVSKVSFDLGPRVAAPVQKPAAAAQAEAPVAPQEAPMFGLFAEKLQAALGGPASKDKQQAGKKK
ncbi:MAG: hypothetical protein AB1714_25395 [Acidobacteriota bacterium]